MSDNEHVGDNDHVSQLSPTGSVNIEHAEVIQNQSPVLTDDVGRGQTPSNISLRTSVGTDSSLGASILSTTNNERGASTQNGQQPRERDTQQERRLILKRREQMEVMLWVSLVVILGFVILGLIFAGVL